MKNTIFITLCCASLMLVTPLSGVAQENTVSNNLPEQPNDVENDCDLCPKKISKLHLVYIESLLNRIEEYDTQLSVLSKDYPKIADLYIELSDSISTLKEMNTDIKPFSPDWDLPIICKIIDTIINIIGTTSDIFFELFLKYGDYREKPFRPFRAVIFLCISQLVLAGFILIYGVGVGFGCY